MAALRILISMEMGLFNLLLFDHCCRRKYSACKTALSLLLFSLFFVALLMFSKEIPADGTLSLAGFIYLLPLNYLYKERPALIFVVMCMTWVYTLSVLSFSVQLVFVLCGFYQEYYILITETALFAITIVPFYRYIVSKYLFILHNVDSFGECWYKYLSLSTCLNFLCLVILTVIFSKGERSFYNILMLLLLLTSSCVSYLILHRIVLDSIKMNQLEHVALHDPLTGLGNRAYLWNFLDSLARTDQVFSILFMDLDAFKQINDQYGHAVGDAYLKHFSKISSSILAGAGHVFRFGGDEFVALYYGAIPEEKIRALNQGTGWEDGAPCPFNRVSIGVLTCSPPHKQDVEHLLRQADRLMYEQKMKKSGTNASA